MSVTSGNDSSLSVEEIDRRVAAGARFLDEHNAGWQDTFLVKKDDGSVEVSLDIRDCRRCLLGKLYGLYSAAIYELISSADAASVAVGKRPQLFGFDLAPLSAIPSQDDWDNLQKAWEREIKAR